MSINLTLMPYHKLKLEYYLYSSFNKKMCYGEDSVKVLHLFLNIKKQ